MRRPWPSASAGAWSADRELVRWGTGPLIALVRPDRSQDWRGGAACGAATIGGSISPRSCAAGSVDPGRRRHRERLLGAVLQSSADRDGVSWPRRTTTAGLVVDPPRVPPFAGARPDVRRRAAAAGRDRRQAQRGGHVQSRCPRRIEVAVPLLVRGDGHRHRGPDGDRDGPPGRARRPAPQPVGRGPGPAGRPGEAVRGRDGHATRSPQLRTRRSARWTRSAGATGSPACRWSIPAGALVGIVTNRDLRFETDMSRRVADVMTTMPLVTGPVGIAAEDAMNLLRQAQGREAAAGRRRRPPARADHRQGLHQERAVPAGHQGRHRPAAGRGGDRLLRRRLEAGDGAGRGRRRRAVRGHRERPRPRRAGHDRPAEGRPVGRARRRHRRQRRHPGRARRRWSTRGRTVSRSASGRARSAPPGWWPGSASRR